MGSLESLKITEFTRMGNNRPVKMLFISYGNYYKIMNDTSIKAVSRCKKDLDEISNMDIPIADKLYLVYECLYVIYSCYAETFIEYLENRYQYKHNWDGYNYKKPEIPDIKNIAIKHQLNKDRFDYRKSVKLIRSKEEIKEIKSLIRAWKCEDRIFVGDKYYSIPNTNLYYCHEYGFICDNNINIVEDGTLENLLKYL